MFSSKGKESVPGPAVPQTPVKRGTRSSAPSIISADLVVHGTLMSAGDIQIDGRVEGDVHAASLVIGDKALIQGEVIAEDVVIRGKVQGSIRARKVLLASTCHVEGNVLHEALAVEQGAFFEGNCRHSDNPLGDANKGSTSVEAKSASGPIPAPAANGMDDSIPLPSPMSLRRTAMVAPLKNGNSA